jgi:hypothetical protein
VRKVVFLSVAVSLLLLASATAGVEVKPYGFILVNVGINDVVGTDIPVSAGIADTTTKTNFLITPRQTRFGLKMSSELEDWDLAGGIELDFWGLKGSGANGLAMQSAPRLRRAYLKMTRDNLTFLVGQEWSIFAPLSPASLAHVSIPGFSSCGNLWNRFPQIRFEHSHDIGENGSVLFQWAAIRPIGADAATATRTQGEAFGAGEYSGLPFFQGRASANFNSNVSIGLSGHYGQEDWAEAHSLVIIPFGPIGYHEDKTTTAAGAVDFKAKAGIFGLSGEWFMGSNLAMLFSNAHVYNEFDAATNTLKVKGVEATGGWGQLSVKPQNTNLIFNTGVGTEILKEEHVDSLITVSRSQLWKNLTFFANIMANPMSNVTVAFEYGYLKTTYKYWDAAATPAALAESDADNSNFNLAFKFDF